MLLTDLDTLSRRYSWLKEMVNYAMQLNREAAALQEKEFLTRKEERKLQELTAQLAPLNPAIDYFIQSGLRNPRFLTMYLYFEYKQALRSCDEPDAKRMFERIRKSFLKDMKEFMEENMN